MNKFIHQYSRLKLKDYKFKDAASFFHSINQPLALLYFKYFQHYSSLNRFLPIRPKPLE
ncbi:hypothetical protein PS619_05651 [Pseudomonas fluorescens]|nr:hypothetical protein PS619_05651 [Pseudomonas fluorescens]